MPLVLTSSPKYTPGIDGVRALAVLLVLLAHAQVPGFSAGFIGVDIFFAISGFLITRQLCEELQQHQKIDYFAFLSRRLKRLLPAFILVGAVTVIGAAVFLLPFAEQQGAALEVISASLFASNFYFAQSVDYFAESSEFRPFLHTWSLAVEEQFYLLWPWLLWISIRYLGYAHMHRLLLGLALALTLIAWLHWQLLPGSAYYMLSARAWEMAFGAALVGLTIRERWSEAAGICGLIVVLAALLIISDTTQYPGPTTFLPVLGSVALLYACLGVKKGWVAAAFASPILKPIGLASYAIYLWHWPLLAIARTAFPANRGLTVDLAMVLLSVLLGWLTYRYVETPFRHSRVSISRIFVTSAAGLGLLVASAGFLGWHAKARGANAPEYAAFVEARGDVADTRCFNASHPCVTEGSKTAVWGDSHALMMSNAIREQRAEQGESVSFFMQPACAPIKDWSLQWVGNDGPSTCLAGNTAAFNRILQLRESGLEEVILIAHWNLHFGVEPLLADGRENHLRQPEFRDLAGFQARFAIALAKTVADFQSVGLRVTVMRAAPELPFSILNCSIRLKDCSFPNQALTRSASLNQVFESILGVQYLDPVPFFCVADTCDAQSNSLLLYRDDNHIRASAAPALWRFMNANR